MKTYPKLYNLWHRDEKTHKLVIGQYAQPEFEAIQSWSVSEKINGVNIRIEYADGQVAFGSRNNDGEIPNHLLAYLQRTFTGQFMDVVFPRDKRTEAYPHVTLFGEGYGPKLEVGGGNYRKDPGFILFDVHIKGLHEDREYYWWLERPAVYAIAAKLGVESVPLLNIKTFIMEQAKWKTFEGIAPKDAILEYVQSKPLSKCSITPQTMEGVVCRSEPLMLFRNGDPIMFKLRCKDFV